MKENDNEVIKHFRFYYDGGTDAGRPVDFTPTKVNFGLDLAGRSVKNRMIFSQSAC